MTDLWFSLRQLLRRPGVSLVAVVTLAVGIGASTAIFSFVNGVLLQPMPYPAAERVVRMFHLNDEGSRAAPSDPDFADIHARSRSFSALAQFGSGRVSVAGGTMPTRSMRALVSQEFFAVMGVQPLLGRGFDADAWSGSDPAVVIVSERYWRQQLDADPDVTRRRLRFGDREHAIAGVMPAGFDYPAQADLWTPLTSYGSSRTAHNWQAIGRLADGVGLAQAQAELASIAHALRAEHGDDSTLAGIGLVGLHEHVTGALRPLLLVLLGAALLLMMIAWANVASLLLARASLRRQELAVRAAVGAGGMRLARQFLTEALLLVSLGAAAGLVIAAACIDLFKRLQPGDLPRVQGIHIDANVLAFVAGLSLLAVLCLGALVAWRAQRDGFTATANQRESAGGRNAVGRALVVAQVAISLVLLVGAGLLIRSFSTLLDVDPGFDRSSVLVVRVSLPYSDAADSGSRHLRFHEAALARFRTLPGVSEAGAINMVPIADGRWNGTFLELARRDEVTDAESFGRVSRMPGRTGLADYRIASDGYFSTMGIPLLQGRAFEPGDDAAAAHVAVISESLARTRWPGQDPLGRLLHFGNMDGIAEPLRVVGVVGDVHESGLDAPAAPTIYASHRQRQTRLGEFSYVLRSGVEPMSLAPQVRQALAAIDPEIPAAFTTLDEVLATSLSQRRLALVLVSAFGIAALALALAGVYAAVAFSVSRRTREIGVRMAIGARSGSVVAMIIGEGLRATALGALLGVLAALALTRTASSLVYGIGSADPATFLLAPALLLAATALAAWLPARRAARVDPINALRSD